MISNDELLSVSDGDILAVSDGDTSATLLLDPSSVSDGDLILAEVQKNNTLLGALLFFTIFVWIEKSVKNSVKKVMDYE